MRKLILKGTRTLLYKIILYFTSAKTNINKFYLIAKRDSIYSIIKNRVNYETIFKIFICLHS